jgi:toxin YoeB
MKYKLKFTKTALHDIEKHKKSGDKPTLNKLSKLLNELILNPKTGAGQPEMLKNELKGYYSRRINKKHRLIYAIKDDEVIVLILNAYSHYGDK